MSRGTSPILIGRDRELDRLRAAIAGARAGDRAVALVSGEAGIGKSRLLAELRASAAARPPGDRPVRFVQGGCLEVGETLPYLPILEWLAELLPAESDESGADDALQLHAEFGGQATPGLLDGGESLPGRSARLQRLRELLVRTAATSDLVLVIDDLQWADRSTLDVVTFLARRLSGTGALLLLLFRSDELHRRHPLTPVLAGLERAATVDHLRLDALDDAEVRSQIAGILGDAADPAEASRVVALADGNPFHVEELLALEHEGPLPSSLREVLDARLNQVDDETLEVLREAAVIGRRVDALLLTTVSQVAADDVDRGLRSAVNARLLVSDPDGRHYRFRHALLREAVYDDMRPVDRIATHRRIAEALRARPELADPVPVVALAELARHWLGARDEPEAFVALVDAGRAAKAATAWPEGFHAYEEALSLWGRVPDPAAVGVPRSRLLEDAAAMAWYMGDTRAALDLTRRTQAEADVQADPRLLGLLLNRESWYLFEDGDVERARALAVEAVRIIPEDPPTYERAMAIGTVGNRELAAGRTVEARAYLEEALAISRSIDDLRSTTAILAFIAMAYADLGLGAEAIAAIEEAEAALPQTAVEGHVYAVTTVGPWVRLAIGDYRGTVRASELAMQLSIERGLDTGGGRWVNAPRAEAEYRLGEWTAAMETIAASETFTRSPNPDSVLFAVAGRVLAGRGDLAAARTAVERSLELAHPSLIDEAVSAGVGAATVALLAGDPDGAARRIRPIVAAWASSDSGQLRAELAHAAAWTAAAMAEPVRRRADVGGDLAAFARDMIAALRAPGATRDGIDPVLDLAAAWLFRNEGDDPEEWRRAAVELERIAYVPLAATARQGEAEACLRRGDRPAAEPAIRAALAHVDAMGASGMREPIERLARAARLPLDASDARVVPGDADPWRLSVRELEVLALVAEGRTNREIGAALFISDKTASVHVTHILTKLGVASRTEAALLAARAGVISGVAGKEGS